MKKIVRESLNEIKRGEPALKSVGAGIIAQIEKWCDDHSIKPYDLNKNFEINAGWVSLRSGTEIPDFIRFNEVGRFTLLDLNVPPDKLGDVLPRKITHSLNIGSSPARYTIRDVMRVCELSPNATVILNSSTDTDVHSRYKLRRKPKRSERVDNVIPSDDPTRKKIDHSYGFKTYSALKFIQAAGEKGRSYTDIITHVHGLSYPGVPLPKHTGYWSGGFKGGGPTYWGSEDSPGPMAKYTDKIPAQTGKRMRYVINDAGRQYLADNKRIFER